MNTIQQDLLSALVRETYWLRAHFRAHLCSAVTVTLDFLLKAMGEGGNPGFMSGLAGLGAESKVGDSGEGQLDHMRLHSCFQVQR